MVSPRKLPRQPEPNGSQETPVHSSPDAFFLVSPNFTVASGSVLSFQAANALRSLGGSSSGCGWLSLPAMWPWTPGTCRMGTRGASVEEPVSGSAVGGTPRRAPTWEPWSRAGRVRVGLRLASPPSGRGCPGWEDVGLGRAIKRIRLIWGFTARSMEALARGHAAGEPPRADPRGVGQRVGLPPQCSRGGRVRLPGRPPLSRVPCVTAP